MTWEEELDKISIRPRPASIDTASTFEENCPRYIKYSDAEVLIKSLLKKQRESCAKTMVDWEDHDVCRCAACKDIWNAVINAKEPVK